MQLFAGKPSRFSVEQITFSREELESMLGDVPDTDDGTPASGVVPGMLLNRLNPLKGLSDEDRIELVAELRNQHEACGSRDLRLALMDEQGIEAALMFPAQAHAIEHEFVDNMEALYANIRAFNRWMYEEVGFAAENRMFLPPYVPLADPELAVGGAGDPARAGRADHPDQGRPRARRSRQSIGRSFARRPGVRPHLVTGQRGRSAARGAPGGHRLPEVRRRLVRGPERHARTFDAFQYIMYWSDRPAMELVAGLVLHSFFSRFPNIRVVHGRAGSVWVPYIVRKMDHAFLMGRKAKFGQLTERPSEIFRRHFLVAPYPEENVQRVISAVGIDPVVFGSDFPHGEGLAFPAEYANTQLAGMSDADVKRIIRDNLAGYLGIAA